ncbi:unnamed protein product [Chondrus crispus]|uniref:Nucleoporin Nup159/Nup146 N-terminal domain-containing protein n=1 Tax=Chondrus crispus TaxID=2769 RepID=R7QGK8_CHOCR|nr:unnamed protein product [Chondrus crispus]CDF36893.1 unnamed protein product [Chondrus crispus]|eukprot:XP_005716712.1 unnamed protein product [Chondrus crispus]
MESLGEPREFFAEFFRCVERQHNPGPATSADFPPANHGNLLASSSRHGYLLVASNREIYIHLLQGLRNKAPGDFPEGRLDLGKHGVKTILDITFVLNDAALVVRAVPEREEDACVLVLSTEMLVKGRAALFNGPPLQRGLNAVAVCPQSFKTESPGEELNQFVALLYGETKVELHAIGTGMADDGTATSAQCSFDAPGPVTSLALSPEDRLLAVGAMRGSVGIHDPKSGARLHNITEIESGWSPFSLHFLDDEALMVSYVRGQDVSHVVWNLVKNGDSLTVKGHSVLGELCLPLLGTFPSSSDGEDGDDENESKPPVIWCHRIPGWDICIVASSKSESMELIALNENGVWVNWKPDEGKMATLPTDENDDDTFPIGIALDLTDTDPVDAIEPALPPLKPMPRVIAFTSVVLLLPFSLVDDRADAGCRFIAERRRIQKTPAEPKPMEKLVFPEVLSAAESSSQEDDHEVPSLPLQEQMAQKPLVEQPFLHGPPVQMPALPTPTTKTTSDFSASSLESEHMLLSGEVTPKDGFHSTLRPPFGVPASISAPETSQDVRDGKSDSSASSVLKNLAFPSFSASVLKRDVPIVVPEQLKPTHVGQISFPVGEPGDYASSIRMVLDEMRTELNMNRIMEESTQKTLFKTNEQMMPHIETVRSELAGLLDVLRKRFHEEASLRREVLTSLKGMNALSREYESAYLEFRVREEEGFVSHLQAEDKIMDDSIVKKEADILKSISAIERKLSTSQNRKPSRLGHAEQVQQIYSSLSLQGIRVKKLRGLLAALSDRIDELDRGGRLTDLGLSMARLEKLSINRIKSPTMNLRQGSRGLRSAERGPGEEFVPKVSSMLPTHPYNSEESLLPGDVQKVLRRLAMRDGRAVIVVQGPQGERRRAEEMSEGKNRFAPDQAEQSLRPGAFYASIASSNGHGQQNIDMIRNRRSETIHSVKNNQTPSFAPLSYQRGERKESSSAGNRVVPSGKRSASASRDPAGTVKEGVGHERGEIPSLASSGNILSNLPEDGQAGAEEAGSKRAFYPPSTSNHFTAREITSKPMTKPNVPSAGIPRIRVPAVAADLFGTSDSVPPVVASSGQPLNAGESPLSFKPVTSGRRQSTKKPPILPHETDTFASLPPEPHGVQRKRSLQQEDSQSAGARAAGTIPVAFLPPDPDSPITSSANPLSNGTKKGSVAQEQSPKASDSPFATLPPEDDRKEVPFASLPPDDDLTIDFSAVVPAGSVPKQKQRENPIPREEVTSSTFTALPPDDDVKPNPVTSKNLSIGPTTGTIGTQLAMTAQSSPPIFGIDSGESNAFGVFGNKLAPEGKPTTSLFGAAQASESKSKSKEESGSASLFATATQSTALQFSNSFSAAFSTQPAEPATSQDDAPANESLPPIDADSSDSDGEENFRREGGFGAMSASKFNAPREQTFQGFGKQAAFGQASASPFATAGTQSGQTSAFSSLTQQHTGPSTSAFTSDASGQTSGFGAPSTLGGGASFGFGSQLGASTQPGAVPQFGQSSQLGGAVQFGANSQLGAGFGAQSSLGGGQSPFSAQPTPAPSGFGSGGPPFGSEMSNVRFGESTFGAPQSGFPGGGASPFAGSGAAFGGQSGGISGFAALAASQPPGGGGSGFGNGMTPIFGNSQGPPSFTSPAFSQRRA